MDSAIVNRLRHSPLATRGKSRNLGKSFLQAFVERKGITSGRKCLRVIPLLRKIEVKGGKWKAIWKWS